METLLLVVHYLLCFLLILAILLQAGKGADIGAMFGGGSQTVFGGRGPASFLTKATAFVAMAFLATSISLAHISKKQSDSTVTDKASVTDTAAPTQSPIQNAAPQAEEKASKKAAPAQEKK